MVSSYRTVQQGGMGEIVEKKSRFLSHIAYAETEKEAIAFIEKIKKKYWDARHHCYAYAIGKRQEIARCSDDGEPSQTAGKPMLDVLLGRGLCDIVVVVTRYFGGTLLGTGGLVRAYSTAVQKGLEKSVLVEKYLAEELVITTDYSGIGKIQYVLGQKGMVPENVIYTDIVVVTVPVPEELACHLEAEITEETNGKAMIRRKRQIYMNKIL